MDKFGSDKKINKLKIVIHQFWDVIYYHGQKE